MSLFDLLQSATFEIGGQDQLAEMRSKHLTAPADDDGNRRLESDWEHVLADLHIKTGTLLKTDTVSFLLGAGASKEAGGPLIGVVPIDVERELLCDGITGQQTPRVSRWLRCFYLALRRVNPETTDIPTTRKGILERRTSVEGSEGTPLPVNFEALLSLLHRWRSTLPEHGGRLRLDGDPPVDLRAEIIEESLHRATSALVRLCRLPSPDADQTGFDAYKDLVRKVLTRPLNLKRANIFTLNYDTLIEQAADAEGVVLLDGFVGAVNRRFRPESYDQDLYFPGETTEGRVHRFDRVLHLYKLHGSINWTAEQPSWENPYGIYAQPVETPNSQPALIYPTPAKWGESLGMPYSELLRRFATTIVKPQSVLFVLGYGFGDEHISAIVRQALAIPSFTLVIVDPNPTGEFAKQLNEQADRRVWILSGDTFGRFTGFVRYALADLRDEGIRRKVMQTHRALENYEANDDEAEDSDA